MTRLISLTMENYRPFYGKNSITFSANPKKHFNVIFAGTGSGKTTVLDAIAWCLYDKEIHKPQPIDTLLNDKKRTELEKGGAAEVRVEIIMGESEEEIDYIISRGITFIKSKDAKVKAIPHSMNFKVKIKDVRGNLIDAASPNVAVNWIFPQAIQHLFMFDGEALQKFFNRDNIEQTKEAITDITQIDHLNAATHHLKDFSRDYKIEVDEGDPEIERYQVLIDSANNQIEQLRLEQAEIEENLEIARSKHQSILDKLQELGAKDKDLKKMLQDEQTASAKLEEAGKELDKLKKESFEHLLDSVPLLFCKNALEKARKLIDSKYESGELPPNMRTDFLTKLLKKEECICGTHLPKGSKERKKVEAYKNKAPLSKYEDAIREGQTQLRMMIQRDIPSFFERRKTYYKNISALGTKISGLNQELALIKKYTKELDKEEIDSLYSQKDFQLLEIEKYNREAAIRADRINGYEGNKENWDAKKRELEKESIKNKEMRDKFVICHDSINFLESIRRELLSEVKTEIEKKTNELFTKSVREPRIAKVCITDTYKCEVKNKRNYDMYESLSSGQRQILATSFMIALRKESGFDSPILIDYPFGRIDPEKTTDLIEALKKVLGGVQVTFFLISGKEYTDSVHHEMKAHIGSLYEIKKVKGEERSEIIKHKVT